jgi:hypothetical protein
MYGSNHGSQEFVTAISAFLIPSLCFLYFLEDINNFRMRHVLIWKKVESFFTKIQKYFPKREITLTRSSELGSSYLRRATLGNFDGSIG